jgi:integrase
LLTGLRRKEAAHLARAEVAADYSQLKLPPTRVKTKVAFTLPLSRAAAAILRSCPEGQWFFAGSRDGRPYWNFDRDKKELDKALNVPNWTLHDCRRTAATLMVRAGVLPHVVEKVLNHVTPGIAGVYQHHNWLEEKRDALERLAALLANIVEGSATAR